MLFCHFIVKVWSVCLFHSNGVITTTGLKQKDLPVTSTHILLKLWQTTLQVIVVDLVGEGNSTKSSQTNKQNKPCTNTALLHDSSHVSFTDDIKPIFAPTHRVKKCSKTHSQA